MGSTKNYYNSQQTISMWAAIEKKKKRLRKNPTAFESGPSKEFASGHICAPKGFCTPQIPFLH